MKRELAAYSIRTIRRVTVRAFGSGKFITSDVEKCSWEWLQKKVERKTKIPHLHQTFLNSDGSIYNPSHAEQESGIEIFLAVNHNIDKQLNILCKNMGIVQLHTVHVRFLTREERFDVLENRLHCLHDVKELAEKKFQIRSWNTVVIINGKQVSDNNATLFEFFLTSNDPNTGVLALQMLAVKAPIEVFILPNYETMSYKDATKVTMKSEETVRTLKEKFFAVKPDTMVGITDLANLELCRYDNPALILEDHQTMDDLDARPKLRFHVRDTVTFQVMQKTAVGVESMQRDIVFVKQYNDQRTYSNLIKHVKKEMGCSPATKTMFELPYNCFEKTNIRKSKEEHDRIEFVIDNT